VKLLISAPAAMKCASDFIAKCVDAIFDLGQIYGFKCSAETEKKLLDRTTKLWVEYAKHSDWMKVVKYKLAAFTAVMIPQRFIELPKSPIPAEYNDKPHVLIGGQFHRFIQNQKRSLTTDKWVSMVYSINQSKKGMPRASKSDLEKAESDTAQELSTENRSFPSKRLIDWADLNELSGYAKEVDIQINDTVMIKQIKRTVRELFQHLRLRDFIPTSPYLPSFNATYTNTRKDGGQYGAVLDEQKRNEYFSKDPLSVYTNRDNEEIEDETQTYHLAGEEKFNRDFQRFWRDTFKEALEEEGDVLLVALAEALKIRVISKGPPLTYYVLKKAQKAMWRELRKIPTFKFIGEPVSEEALLEILGKPINYRKKGKYYLSIDYKSATDLLRSVCSDTITLELGLMFAEQAYERLEGTQDYVAYTEEIELIYDFVRLMSKSMTGHTFDTGQIDPEKSGETIKLKQKKGQLMGSIISFPYLCTLNTSICRHAKEVETGRVIAIKDLPLAINGDDAVMPTNRIGDLAWKRISEHYGMQESIGKVLRSDVYLNINSRMFKAEDYKFSAIGHVNLGLAYGLPRSQAGGVGKSNLDDWDFGARHRELKKETPPELWEAVDKIFKRKLNKQLKRYPEIPWYIPEELGGFGMVGKPSDKDLVIARAIINHMVKKLPQPSKPPPTELVKVYSAPITQYMPNVTHTYTLQRVIRDEFTEKVFNTFYCGVAYYHPNLLKGEDELAGTDVTRYIRRNARVWKGYLHNYGLFGSLEPFKVEVHELLEDGNERIYKVNDTLKKIRRSPLLRFKEDIVTFVEAGFEYAPMEVDLW
jgi:hypothetical protein